jgi:hypothetical protein
MQTIGARLPATAGKFLPHVASELGERGFFLPAKLRLRGSENCNSGSMAAAVPESCLQVYIKEIL